MAPTCSCRKADNTSSTCVDDKCCCHKKFHRNATKGCPGGIRLYTCTGPCDPGYTEVGGECVGRGPSPSPNPYPPGPPPSHCCGGQCGLGPPGCWCGPGCRNCCGPPSPPPPGPPPNPNCNCAQQNCNGCQRSDCCQQCGCFCCRLGVLTGNATTPTMKHNNRFIGKTTVN